VAALLVVAMAVSIAMTKTRPSSSGNSSGGGSTATTTAAAGGGNADQGEGQYYTCYFSGGIDAVEVVDLQRPSGADGGGGGPYVGYGECRHRQNASSTSSAAMAGEGEANNTLPARPPTCDGVDAPADGRQGAWLDVVGIRSEVRSASKRCSCVRPVRIGRVISRLCG
jgi:hypothetical protein